MKCKNLYKNKNGNNTSTKTLVSKLRSTNKLLLTNNICESMHGLISKHLQNKSINKNIMRDTLNYILNKYYCKNTEIVRKDYITRTLILYIFINKPLHILGPSDFENKSPFSQFMSQGKIIVFLFIFFTII